MTNLIPGSGRVGTERPGSLSIQPSSDSRKTHKLNVSTAVRFVQLCELCDPDLARLSLQAETINGHLRYLSLSFHQNQPVLLLLQ